nr:glycosyltransferase [Promineifilum sp.]
MRVSVIIPSLNAPTLPRALAAVAAQTEPPAEIIVVGRDEAGAAAAFPLEGEQRGQRRSGRLVQNLHRVARQEGVERHVFQMKPQA